MNTATTLKQMIEDHIGSLGYDQKSPGNLYAPIHYILTLKGKRIRPILLLMAYEAVSGKKAHEALNLAATVECFHNFTLMHDDIMDQAPVRRGQPSVHIAWDENIAILSGDALFALSMEMVVMDFPQRAPVLVKQFSKIATEVCEGQTEDMDMSSSADVSIPQYLEMIRKKTAVLLGGCMSMGAIAGEANEEVISTFYQFGESLGMAFQLQDDLMDAFPPEGFGKQVGGDIKENKKTFLLLKAMEKATDAQQEILTNALGMESENPEKLEIVLQIYRDLCIPGETKEMIEKYILDAKQLAETLSSHTSFSMLKSYISAIANRQF
ncbi:MAG: polyprenyl synthetase family protein [Bacteroidota bacterium]